jgi:small subunit ribosomal protein S4
MDKIGPKHRTCRRVGEPLCGRPNCPSNKRPYPPGQHGRGRKRISEYQTRLVEKQKLRAIYGVSESQMRRYYDEATAITGVTGEELIRRLETRLDTVVLRLGFALTTRQARQLVSHGHVLLDGSLNMTPCLGQSGMVRIWWVRSKRDSVMFSRCGVGGLM